MDGLLHLVQWGGDCALQRRWHRVCLNYFCCYCQFIIIINTLICIIFSDSDSAYWFAYGSLCAFLLAMLTASVSLSVFVFPFSDYCVIMICMYIVIGYQLWWTLFYLIACLFHLFQFITTVYLLLANTISDLICCGPMRWLVTACV